MKNVVIVGAGGRDFHNFNVVFRGDADVKVVAFTAAQIPNIDHRTYPPELAGPGYPDGIPIVPESELLALIRDHEVDEVVFAYSDIAYPDLMHLAAKVLAAGPDFRLVGMEASALRSRKPVVAVCATRTGCGKSQTSRAVARILQERGLRVALVRHPMPYGNLHDMRVQRFRTLEEIDASHPTIEEREEYELPVREGVTVYAGVDYGDILALAEEDADVVLWDGGNNDLPFYVPDLMIVVADALRPGHETAYHPGEAHARGLTTDELVDLLLHATVQDGRPVLDDATLPVGMSLLDSWDDRPPGSISRIDASAITTSVGFARADGVSAGLAVGRAGQQELAAAFESSNYVPTVEDGITFYVSTEPIFGGSHVVWEQDGRAFDLSVKGSPEVALALARTVRLATDAEGAAAVVAEMPTTLIATTTIAPVST